MQIEFEQASHTYRVGGEVWPSVTQVLEPLQELDGIPREVLRAAAEFGTHVHQACHLHNQGVLDSDSLDPKLAPYIEAWRAFLRDTGASVLASEQRVCHPTLKYAGCLDAVVLWKGRRCVVDIKSGAQIPRTTAPQLAAYREALGERRLPRYCVQLRPDATYRAKSFTDSADWNVFVSALNIWRWRNGNART